MLCFASCHILVGGLEHGFYFPVQLGIMISHLFLLLLSLLPSLLAFFLSFSLSFPSFFSVRALMCFDTAGRAGQVSQRHFASPSCAPQNMKHKRTSEATGLGVASLFLVFMTETQIVKVWLLPSPLCLALFFLPSLPCSFFPYFGCFSLLCFLRLSPLPLPSFWSRIFFLLSSSLPIFFSFPFLSFLLSAFAVSWYVGHAGVCSWPGPVEYI